MKKIFITASLLLAFNSAFAASMQSLNQAQMKQTFQDKTMTTIPLATVDGQLVNNPFTGFFNKNGQTTGQFATKINNDPQSDTGTWSVQANGAICVTWQHWNQQKPICVVAYKLSNSLILVNTQTKKLETIILNENIEDGNQLSS